jgi:integrase
VFLGSLAGERLHAPMLLSLLGLRPAEVCGLRWSDVDLDAGELKVERTRTLVASDGGIVVVEKGPKSASGRRTLPLPPQTSHEVVCQAVSC